MKQQCHENIFGNGCVFNKMTFTPENVDMTIPEFFKDKSVFITGGSGFIGRVLIEKLLRSCPDLKNIIYVLIRSKKNMTIEERIHKLTDVPLFDELRKKNTNFQEKLIPNSGNIKELELRISENDRIRIIENVSIVYHSAASVRFDDHLKDAIFTNVRSTREIINLAQELKTLDVMVHVSTLYSNSDNKSIEEKLYPRHDWRDVIQLAETCDTNVLEAMTKIYIAPLYNTYLFTKSVAELAVHELCDNKLPVVICRPSIVIPTACDPIVGWVDNFNGPLSINVAGALGLMGITYCDKDVRRDYVFVDNVVKAIIIATWRKSLDFRTRKQNILICNVSSDVVESDPVPGDMLKIIFKNPPEMFLWPFSFRTTKCWYKFHFSFLILQILPAILVDVLLKVTGKNLRLQKIQKRVYIAIMAISPFLMYEWKSINPNYVALENGLLAADKDNFSFFHLTDVNKMYDEFWGPCKMFLLNRKPTATKKEVARYKLFYNLSIILNYALIGWVLYFAIWKYEIATRAYESIYNYMEHVGSSPEWRLILIDFGE